MSATSEHLVYIHIYYVFMHVFMWIMSCSLNEKGCRIVSLKFKIIYLYFHILSGICTRKFNLDIFQQQGGVIIYTLGYERVHGPLYKIAHAPFHIQDDGISCSIHTFSTLDFNSLELCSWCDANIVRRAPSCAESHTVGVDVGTGLTIYHEGVSVGIVLVLHQVTVGQDVTWIKHTHVSEYIRVYRLQSQ